MNRKKQQISLALVLGTALYCACPMYASAANSGGHFEGGLYIGDNGPADNKLIIDTAGSTIYGGYSERSKATNNIVTVVENDQTFTNEISGGWGGTWAKDNTVTIHGGTFIGNIYGGFAMSDASGNTVTIHGGTFNDATIYGGFASRGTTEDNTVTIKGGTFNDVSIYGGTAPQSSSGNTLNIHVKGITAKIVESFSTYNFYLPSNIQNGDTVITVTDPSGTDLSRAAINVGVEGNASIKIGDTITLIQNESGIDTTGTTYGKLTEGVSLNYELESALNEAGTGIVSTVTKAAPTVNNKTKSLLETQTAAMSFLNSGADRLASGGISSAKDASKESNRVFTPFASIGGDSMRYDSGSYADVKGLTGSIGMAKTIASASGSLTFGPFIEGGQASYDSYLDDGTHADGKTKFYGVGFFAREDHTGGNYVEGSLRLGRTTSDYASGDLVNSAGEATTYDTKSPYYGFHLGFGQVRNVGENHTLDLYGKYFYSRQNTESARLSSGETYDFGSVDSSRLRVGGRYANAYSKTRSTYVGLAYEYEFSGKATATYKGFDIPSPTLRGGSAMLEIGYALLPSEDGRMSADVALTGWTGQKKGVGLNARVAWGF